MLEGIVTQALIPRADGKGRVVALEILVPTPAIRNLIRDDKIHQIYGAMQAVMDGCPPPGKFKSAGRFVTRPLAGDKIRALTDSLRNAPAAAAPAYKLYALGGAAGIKARCDTAFFFRDAAYIAQIEASWEQDEAGAESAAWVDRNFPYLAGLTAGSWVSCV